MASITSRLVRKSFFLLRSSERFGYVSQQERKKSAFTRMPARVSDSFILTWTLLPPPTEGFLAVFGLVAPGYNSPDSDVDLF